MKLDGTIDANLLAAISSAKRLRGHPVYAETLAHWKALLAEARQQRLGFDDARRLAIESSIAQLESEIADRPV